MTTADFRRPSGDYATHGRRAFLTAGPGAPSPADRLHKASDSSRLRDAPVRHMAKAVATAQGWEYDPHDGFSVGRDYRAPPA